MTPEQIRRLLHLEREIEAHHRQRDLVRASLLRVARPPATTTLHDSFGHQ